MSPNQLRRPLSAVVLTALSVCALAIPAHAEPPTPTKITSWGADFGGQRDVPTSLDGQHVDDLSAGHDHSLALTDDGKVTAWGDSTYGATDVPSSLDDKTVTDVEAGFFDSFAITADGKVTAWGHDDYGQTDVPASLDDKTVTAVAAGYNHSLALTDDGKVTAWGYNGDGETDIPASLDNKTVTAVAAGYDHNLALTDDGHVVAWGYSYGGSNVNAVPASLDDKTVIAISAGVAHSLALTDDGKVTAWGGDDDGMFGNDFGQSDVPASLDGQTVTGIEAGAYSSFALSDDQTLVLSGSASISGTPKVGKTLTAQSTVTSTPDATTSGQWLRDGDPISNATGWSYTLTAADQGSQISYRVTATKEGYDSASTTSEPVGPVAKGAIALPAPTISGTPAVEHPLTGTVTGVDPDDAGLTYAWTRDETIVGTSATYTPTPADEGHMLVLTVTATKAGYDDNTSAASTPEIAASTFTSGPSASISGTIQVGQTLSAGAGEVAPDADFVSYQWYADDEPIAGATGHQLTLTAAERHATITVEVTAHRAGYADSSDTSEATAPVASKAAPQLQLDASPKQVELGQSTVLSWSSDEADSLTASGGWSGQRASESSESVTPTALGTTTYTLSASNDQGTTTTQAAVEAIPATKTIPLVSTVAGTSSKSVRVQAQGMYPNEAYSIRISRDDLVTGVASAAGTIDRTVKRGVAASAGHTRVKLTGMADNRSSHTYVRNSSDKSLDVMVNPRVTQTQLLKVSGLAPNEKIDITYRGEQLVAPATARADKDGSYQLLFPVGSESGQRRVSVTGLFSGRTATATFTVVAPQ